MIESISMGKLLYNGKVSRSDTIVYADRMDTKWWIKERNCIQMNDLDDVLAAKPELIVFGTGFMMPISMSDEAQAELKGMGIELFIDKSDVAMETYNDNVNKRRTVGLFHLL